MGRKSAKAEGNPTGVPDETLATGTGDAEPEISPLDYMLSVLRDETASRTDRKWAAAHAAPYVHQKLPTGEAPRDGSEMTHEEWLELLD
jgi:hypothetical protein